MSTELLQKHIRTITQHKLSVMTLCFRCGLYKQGLLHDLSKYMWSELSVGATYYQGNRSPNAIEREVKGFSTAWMHHKGRNKHHYEYWLDFTSRRTEGASVTTFTTTDGMQNYVIAAPMPTRYVVEMFCDRVAACKVYQKENYTQASALEYYLREIPFVCAFMHPDTAAMLYVLLDMLAQDGEDATIDFIRSRIVQTRYVYNELAGY